MITQRAIVRLARAVSIAAHTAKMPERLLSSPVTVDIVVALWTKSRRQRSSSAVQTGLLLTGLSSSAFLRRAQKRIFTGRTDGESLVPMTVGEPYEPGQFDHE